MNAYFKTFLYASLDNINKLVSILLVNSLISRTLSVSSFGLYSYYIFIITFLINISKFGLDNLLVIAYVSEDQRSKHILTTNLIILRIFLCLILSIIILVFSKQLSIPYHLYWFFSLPLYLSLFDFAEFYFLARQKNKVLVIVKTGLAVMSFAIRLIIMSLHCQSMNVFLFAFLFDLLCLFGVYIYLLSRDKIVVSIRFFRKEIFKELLKRGTTLLGIGLSIFFVMRVNMFFIEKYCTAYDMGIYSPALRICELLNTVALLFINVITPLIVKTSEDTEYLYKMVYSVLFWMCVAFIVPLYFIAKPLIEVLFGQDYGEGYVILRIVIWSMPFVSVGMFYGRILIHRKMDSINFKRMIVSALFSIVVSYVLIKRWGILGAAYSYFFSQLFANLLIDLFHRQVRKDFFNKLSAFCSPRLLMSFVRIGLVKIKLIDR